MWVPPHRLCAHPSSVPYCVIAGKLLYLCLGSSWLHEREDGCSHRLPGGCGERRVSARGQLCRAPGVVTVRASGLMPLGEDGPDGDPLEADPRLPQH